MPLDAGKRSLTAATVVTAIICHISPMCSACFALAPPRPLAASLTHERTIVIPDDVVEEDLVEVLVLVVHRTRDDYVRVYLVLVAIVLDIELPSYQHPVHASERLDGRNYTYPRPARFRVTTVPPVRQPPQRESHCPALNVFIHETRWPTNLPGTLILPSSFLQHFWPSRMVVVFSFLLFVSQVALRMSAPASYEMAKHELRNPPALTMVVRGSSSMRGKKAERRLASRPTMMGNGSRIAASEGRQMLGTTMC